jgi:hypothetical protein
MTSSFIHAAFDPQPFVVFSICAIATGALLETAWTHDKLRRFKHYLSRHMTRHAVLTSDRSGSRALGIAKH